MKAGDFVVKDDFGKVLEFAQAQTGGADIWLEKIADNGGPAVLVPKSK